MSTFKISPQGSSAGTKSSHKTHTKSLAANGAVHRRTVVQGGLAAAMVQLAAAGASQARQEPINKDVAAADSPFIQELLRRTEEKKEQRAKERLDAYYKKNFKDYFEFDGGSARAAAARGISAETQQAISRWLEENK